METSPGASATAEQTPAKPERIVLSLAEQRQPGARERRMAEAAAAGLEFVIERPESYAEQKFREYGERADLPTVSVSDSAAFIANLGKIASGQIRAI